MFTEVRISYPTIATPMYIRQDAVRWKITSTLAIHESGGNWECIGGCLCASLYNKPTNCTPVTSAGIMWWCGRTSCTCTACGSNCNCIIRTCELPYLTDLSEQPTIQCMWYTPCMHTVHAAYCVGYTTSLCTIGIMHVWQWGIVLLSNYAFKPCDHHSEKYHIHTRPVLCSTKIVCIHGPQVEYLPSMRPPCTVQPVFVTAPFFKQLQFVSIHLFQFPMHSEVLTEDQGS